MAYRLRRSENIQTGIRRIASEQMQRAIDEMENTEIDRHDVVHQVRKRCKKLRGLLRLVRPAIGKTYRAENAVFRDAARALSSIRDASSIIGTFDRLIADVDLRPSEYEPIQAELQRSRAAITEDQIEAALAHVHHTLTHAKERASDWSLSYTGFAALEPGLTKTHERVRESLAVARQAPDSNTLHELRKQAKYHWYQTRLLRGCWPAMFDSYEQALNVLCELIGEDHNLAILRNTLSEASDRSACESLITMIGNRHTAMKGTVLQQSEVIFGKSNSQFASRIRPSWKLWRTRKS